MRRVRIVFLLVFISGGLIAQQFEFYKEKLEFELSESGFSVNGAYFFRNNAKDTIRQFLLYPFPDKAKIGDITVVEGASIYPDKKNDVVVGWNQKAARLRLFILPFDTAVLNIRYNQALVRKQAEYILTSTQRWQKPLEDAMIRMHLPMDLKIDSLSYDADEMVFTDVGLMYTWRFYEFMPQQNFFVSFSKINQTPNRGQSLPETQIKRLPARP